MHWQKRETFLCTLNFFWYGQKHNKTIRRRPKSFLFAQTQLYLVCASASLIDLRRHRSFWYAQAQIYLACAGAGSFCMRRRIFIWYEQAHLNLGCAEVCPFCMRRRRSIWYTRKRRFILYAQAQVIFMISCA